MNKLCMILLTLMTGQVFAQKSNVESAVIYMRNSELEDAKKAIDEAAINADTKDDPKMWSVRAAVYDSIVHNPDFKNLDVEKEEKYIVACLKCLELDTKKRFEEYCSYAVVNSAFSAYNKAVEYSINGDAPNAFKYFDYVIKVFPYDKNGDLKKNNINEKTITLNMASLALKAKNFDAAKKNLQKLIDMDYNDPIIYLLMANIYYNAGDTATGLSFTDKGRKRFQSDKDLINQELNIYLAQGKQNVLLDKLNEALTIDEENTTLLFVRGNVYDNYSVKCQREYKLNKDTAVKMTNKAKTEKNPVLKGKLDGAVKLAYKNADSLQKATKTYSTMAEKDYVKVTELNSEYLDAFYNLGALNNNRTTEIVEKMNALNSSSQSEYDKKWNALKKVQDSILRVSLGYFSKALELAENLPSDDADKAKYKKSTLIEIYYSLQQVYANLGDEKTTIEYMKKRKELENE